MDISASSRSGSKVTVSCESNITIFELKELMSVKLGTKPHKIILKKAYQHYKDQLTLEDYEIVDGINFELYYR